MATSTGYLLQCSVVLGMVSETKMTARLHCLMSGTAAAIRRKYLQKRDNQLAVCCTTRMGGIGKGCTLTTTK